MGLKVQKMEIPRGRNSIRVSGRGGEGEGGKNPVEVFSSISIRADILRHTRRAENKPDDDKSPPPPARQRT